MRAEMEKAFFFPFFIKAEKAADKDNTILRHRFLDWMSIHTDANKIKIHEMCVGQK